MNENTYIEDEGYRVVFEHTQKVVQMSGVMRLNGLQEYAPITALLSNALESGECLTLDLTNLEFLNSSGIATLSKFVIEARKHQPLQLTIKGSKHAAWQSKSLTNLKRLMPTLDLQLL